MTPDQKSIARKFFQLEILKRNGQNFEDFFVSIMNYRFPAFKAVRTYGSIGDRKNDGFDSNEGKYYQVYAPKDLSKSLTKAIKKLHEDFVGLYDQWNDSIPISEFSFVINDKYEGIHPDLALEMGKMKKDFKEVSFNSFSASDLERLCFELADDQILAILGSIPSTDLELFDDITMKEVIDHLLNIEMPYSEGSFPNNPDFDKKIEFNSLSKEASDLLRFASFKEADLKDYFKLKDAQVKEKLRNIFNTLYKEGRKLFPEENASDKVFFHILKESSKENKKFIQDAILVLMSYYFTYCDIFEEPTAFEQSELF